MKVLSVPFDPCSSSSYSFLGGKKHYTRMYLKYWYLDPGGAADLSVSSYVASSKFCNGKRVGSLADMVLRLVVFCFVICLPDVSGVSEEISYDLTAQFLLSI